MKSKKTISTLDAMRSIRKPIPKPSIPHKDPNRYKRKFDWRKAMLPPA